MIRQISSAFAAALIIAAAASPALASGGMVTDSARVRISDIDVQSPQGAKTLIRRVTYSAMDVCSQSSGTLYSDLDKSARKCVAAAVAKAIGHLDAPAVTAEYTRQFGAAPAMFAAR